MKIGEELCCALVICHFEIHKATSDKSWNQAMRGITDKVIFIETTRNLVHRSVEDLVYDD